LTVVTISAATSGRARTAASGDVTRIVCADAADGGRHASIVTAMIDEGIRVLIYASSTLVLRRSNRGL
jgi:hypothetical protein